MWSSRMVLVLMGLLAGGAIAAGTFAFVIIIGVVPRLIGKCHRAAGTDCFENAIILGGALGNVWCFLENARLPLGQPFLLLYGVSAGVFVGCIAIALAEILNTFPILFRRFHIKEGLFWMVLSLGMGKVAGAFYYFLTV